MTNQSQPLTLQLSNGQEVSIAEAKSVLQHTENGQQRSCAIVRGPNGAAIYNAEGDVQINGAPSSAHWLQQGDTLDFGQGVSASVKQLGVLDRAIDSLLTEAEPSTSISVDAQAAPAIPAAAPSSVLDGNDTFTPATAAANFTPEPQPVATPTEPAELVSAAGLAAQTAEPTNPDAAAAALALTAGLMRDAVPAEAAEAVMTPIEPTSFTSGIPAAETASAVPTTGFAAELLASIQADENKKQRDENETVGSLNSETTHSPLAADGSSFPSPATEPTSISSLIPELPSTSALAPLQNEPQEDQPNSLQTPEPAPIEKSTESTQSSSVSALLERMKEEGQWGGLSEEAAEEATTPATPELQETPVLDQADEDVQSYMNQLLSRMRGPGDDRPQPAAASVEAPKPDEAEAKEVEAPKPVGLLKPEEYIPKNKAKRLDSLQDMRALANNQTRTAIDRSQAKRREASIDIYYLTIGVGGVVAAAGMLGLSFLGYLPITAAIVAVVLIAAICVCSFFGKDYITKMLESKKSKNSATPPEAVETPHETHQDAVQPD